VRLAFGDVLHRLIEKLCSQLVSEVVGVIRPHEDGPSAYGDLGGSVRAVVVQEIDSLASFCKAVLYCGFDDVGFVPCGEHPIEPRGVSYAAEYADFGFP
jgi:hypothetical protein